MASNYATRDPQPGNRDPQVTTRDPQPELAPCPPVMAAEMIEHVPVIRVEPIRCARCGEPGIWRPGGTTVPNVTTQEMFRWRACAHCKKTQYIARKMTEAERRKYIAPQSV